MPEYLLSQDVYVCCREGVLIFADVARDDYILVDGDAAAALLGLLAPSSGTAARQPTEADAAVLKGLLDAGLLTTCADRGRPLALTAREPVIAHLIDPDESRRVPVSPVDVWRFFLACVKAARSIRRAHLRDIIARMRERKSARSSRPHTVDLERARELTIKFRRMRHFFPRNYLCLYDSLALLEFLARYDVFPTWVFGVTLEPWAAHCWVQAAGFTFNESVEDVAHHTPVLAV